MKCPKCNNYNNDNAKFCRKCGAPLAEEAKAVSERGFFEDNKKMIISVIIIAIVIAAISAYFLFFNNNVSLQNQNFGAFSMSVPVGSNFVEDAGVDLGIFPSFKSYKNNGDYSKEAYFLAISSFVPSPPSGFKLNEQNGGLEIYSDDNGGFFVVKHIDSYYFSIMGNNLDVLKEMANSIYITGNISNNTCSTTQDTSSSNQQSAANKYPLNILGGSFSTGSELSDKTNAKLYLGQNHAGEKVIVQIFYSRDGNSLNNGNMVPVTVDSNGYVSVSSADSYSKFPDYATIKLYDANSILQDTVSVTLSPSSGTQTF